MCSSPPTAKNLQKNTAFNAPNNKTCSIHAKMNKQQEATQRVFFSLANKWTSSYT
jgi:hypothetical protein